jgi:Mg2+ and Co2+ transporter CorA
MNIHHWPGPDNQLGWIWVWFITLVTTGVLYFYLKRRGWW